MRIVLATKNKGKVSEFQSLFNHSCFQHEIINLDAYPELDKIPENGRTFKENAFIKAKTVADYTQLLSIADDSGLEVDVLNGEPGIYSARYSGEQSTDQDNNQKLLNKLHDIPIPKRTARFRCALVAFAPNGQYLDVEGIWEGLVAESPHGEKGFGYDPIFWDQDYEMTAADMDQQTKNKLSHRGKALRKLIKLWPEFLNSIDEYK